VCDQTVIWPFFSKATAHDGSIEPWETYDRVYSALILLAPGGQGILTALAQIAAEELDVEFDKIQMVSAGQNAAVTARDPSSRELQRRAPNSAHHPIVDAAPTEMIRERVLDLFVAWIAIAVQEDLCGHDDSGGAIAALCRLLGDECLLQGVRVLHRAQSLQRSDVIVLNVPERRRAGPDQIAADYRSASSALPESATEFGPIQSEVVPQNVEQGCVGAGVDKAGFAVDCNASGHVPSLSA